MPRRLLRDRRIVEDDWHYAIDAPADAASVILSLEQWQLERDRWLSREIRLGVLLLPEHKVESVAPELANFALVVAQFSGPSEGRGYTQARLLRERFQFGGEVRAAGYVRLDQLFFLARCGFNSFELPDADLPAALAAFSTFTAAYQPSNDAGLPVKLDIPASA